MSRPKDSRGLPSDDPLNRRLAVDDVTMLAFAALAALGAAFLLALGF